MSGFGDWYKEQQQQQQHHQAGNESNSGGMLDGILSQESLPLFFTETTGALNANISSLTSSLEAQLPQKVLGMNYQQRFKVFIICLFISGLFFSLAFFVGLPMITVRPQKFAISFTFGSLSFMSSFAILKGPTNHFMGMLSKDRIAFTTAYLLSMFATVYLTFTAGGVKGYVLVLSASALQLVALLWYLMTFIPGGTNGLKVVGAGMIKILQPVLIAISACCRSFVSLFLSWCSR